MYFQRISHFSHSLHLQHGIRAAPSLHRSLDQQKFSDMLLTNWSSASITTSNPASPNHTAQSLDLVRRATTFFLAVYLWLHAFFLFNIQSNVISRISGIIRLTATEIIIFVLLIVFSFLAASGFWKTLRSFAYIYFFPFVLLAYGFYLLYLALRAVNRWIKKHDERLGNTQKSESVPLLIDSPAKTPGAAEVRSSEPQNSARLILRFLLRPFTRFMFLWCILLLATTHQAIVCLCLAVVLVHLVRKLFLILKVLFFSDAWLTKIGMALPDGLHTTIAALSAVTSDSASTNELKNLWHQLNFWKKLLNFLKNPYLLARWAWVMGIMFLGSLYLYIAALFSFVYYGIARIQGVSYSWSDALVSSVFIPFLVTELPKLVVLRLVGGIQCVLVLTVGISTIVNFLQRKLDAVRRAASELSDRLSEQSLQEKYLILEQKVAAVGALPPITPANEKKKTRSPRKRRQG